MRLPTLSPRHSGVHPDHDLCENVPVTAPNCPTCGYPLRWFATHNAWGCDRCQALIPSVSPAPIAGQAEQVSPYAPIPSHVQDHPSQPYSPFRAPTGPAPEAAPPKKSRKGLFVALAIGGVALIGGIVAIAVLAGDDKPSRSRDAVIKQTIAALAAGDEDKLYGLADPKRTFEKVARCEKRSKDNDDSLDPDLRRISRAEADYRDPEKLEARWKKDIGQLLRRSKGAKIEIVDILTEMPPPIGTKPKKSKRDDDDDDDYKDRDRDRDRYRDDDEDRPERDKEFKTVTFKKGHEVMRGCYARQVFRRQQVKVVVDIKEGEREFTQRVNLTLAEIDGNWYLAALPSLNVGLDTIVADVEEWKTKTCKCTDAACVEDLDEEHGRLAYVQYELDRDADLPRETMTRIEKLHSERKVCEGTARGGPELARYKELKDQLCACKEEECGKKIELEMIQLRGKVEANLRRARVPSYEVTRQVSDLAMAASECTRKLALLRVRATSAWPSSGETTGGTFITVRGSNFTSTPRTAKVFFGTKEATSARIISDYEMVVETPPQDEPGFVEVRVEFTPGGTITLPYGFTYRAPLKPTRPKPRPRPTPVTP